MAWCSGAPLFYWGIYMAGIISQRSFSLTTTYFHFSLHLLG